MVENSDAKAFFLEGFPREARQVEDFEREVIFSGFKQSVYF